MKIVYQCEICGVGYDNEEEARKCEAQPFSPNIEVGDIVLARSGFGWFDGDVRWVSNPDVRRNGHARPVCPDGDSNCFDVCCTYSFYYVVTAIDGDRDNPHRPRYHLFTRAMSGKSGYRSGYTFDKNHWTPHKVENPPAFVVRSSKKLIGSKANVLL